MTHRLLERTSQLEVLQTALRRAAAGRGGNIVLRGEQGSGRTALLERFAVEAAGTRSGGAETVTVVSVTATRQDADTPLVLVQALLDRLDPAVPEVASALDVVDDALRGDDRRPGRLVARPVVAAIEAVVRAAAGPLLVVVDDADWADPASEDVLLRLAARTRDLPLLLVCSRLAIRHPTADQAEVEVIRQQLASDVITLGPLTPRAARAWVDARGEGLDTVSREELLRLSGRLPGRMVELAPAVLARQAAPLTDGPWPELTMSRMRRAHLVLLDGLSAPEQRVLLLVGLAGELRAQALARVADLGDAADHADALVRAEVLVDDIGSLALRDPALLLTLVSGAPGSAVRRAHADLAEALEGSAPADVVLEHRVRGEARNGPEVGGELAAAAAGLAVLETRRAAALYERAAALEVDEQDRALWLVRAAEACWWADRPGRSAMLLTRLPVLEPAGPAAGAAAHLAAQQAFSRRDHLRALELLVLALAAPDPRSPQRTLDAVLLHRHLGVEYAAEVAGEHDDADAARAAERLPEAERAVVEADRLVHLPWTQVAVAERTDAFHVLLGRLPCAGYPVLLPPAGAALVMGTHEALGEAARLRWERVRSASGAVLRTDALVALAASEVEVMATHGALDRAAEVEALADGWTPRARMTQRVVSATAGLLTDGPDAVATAEQLVLELGPGLLATTCGPMMLWSLSEAVRRTGDVDGASRHLAAMRPPGSTPDEWCALPVSSGNQAPFWSVVSGVSVLLRQGGRDDEIKALVAALEEWAELTGSAVPRHQLQAVRSLLVEQPGARESALQDAHDTAPSIFARGIAALRLGEALRRQRRLVEARTHLQEAADVFERLQMTAYFQRAVTEIAATAPQRPPRTVASTALTAQEHRVAQQAAGGLSNRQIAAALDISPRTVAHHLEAVYVKLSVAGRTELADKLVLGD